MKIELITKLSIYYIVLVSYFIETVARSTNAGIIKEFTMTKAIGEVNLFTALNILSRNPRLLSSY